MRRPVAVALSTIAVSFAAVAAEPAPPNTPAVPGHDPTHPPIDCPLHQHGVDPG